MNEVLNVMRFVFHPIVWNGKVIVAREKKNFFETEVVLLLTCVVIPTFINVLYEVIK